MKITKALFSQQLVNNSAFKKYLKSTTSNQVEMSYNKTFHQFI